MKKTLANTAIAAAIFASATTSALAAPNFLYPVLPDGSQYFNSRAVAGAAPNLGATFIYGVRCHYEYRIQYGERVRVQVCN
jgi:hypothetical protein